MTTIPLYTGQAAKAAILALGWRRVALRASPRWRVEADHAEAANLFRLARSIWEGVL